MSSGWVVRCLLYHTINTKTLMLLVANYLSGAAALRALLACQVKVVDPHQ